MNVALPANWTMALMRIEARPVTVMQPAMIPAIAHATATVMAPFAPASSESTDGLAAVSQRAAHGTDRRLRALSSPASGRKKLTRPTAMAARMEYAAECDIVFAPEETSQTSRISGRIR